MWTTPGGTNAASADSLEVNAIRHPQRTHYDAPFSISMSSSKMRELPTVIVPLPAVSMGTCPPRMVVTGKPGVIVGVSAERSLAELSSPRASALTVSAPLSQSFSVANPALTNTDSAHVPADQLDAILRRKIRGAGQKRSLQLRQLVERCCVGQEEGRMWRLGQGVEERCTAEVRKVFKGRVRGQESLWLARGSVRQTKRSYTPSPGLRFAHQSLAEAREQHR